MVIVIKFPLVQFCGLLTKMILISQMASILMLDSPVGSGFSYAHNPKGYDVGDYSSSLQVHRFLNKVTTCIVVDVL